jgi:hypothetical protein
VIWFIVFLSLEKKRLRRFFIPGLGLVDGRLVIMISMFFYYCNQSMNE